VGGEGATFAAAQACARTAGGHAVAVACPPDVDPWGEAGELLPLFRALKERFDPGGVLNPGRFIGGI
jgi:glycolate oxidase FAD binding subunit